MSNPRPRPDAIRRPSRRERGQALVLIALAFVGLAAFIGLAVDAGILFTQIGHLRRAVDAAALGAANQFREGRTVSELTAAATEFINLNGVSTGTAKVFICEEPFGPPPYSSAHDPSLCPSPGDPYRKFVRVEGEVVVNFAFLPIIGITSFPIRADAVSETASVDLVLVVDTSSSMSWDLCFDGIDNDEDGVVDDCPSIAAAGPLPGENNPAVCNANRFLTDDQPGDDPGGPPDGDREDDCHPFEEVRKASEALLSRMYFPYDRMGVVTYAELGGVQISLAAGNNQTDVFNTLQAIEVSVDPGNPPCNFGGTGDPRGCTGTNTSSGVLQAGNLFGDPNNDGIQSPGEIRQEAVWIMILLSDGAANALYKNTSGLGPADPNNWICPNTAGVGNPEWIRPFCTDVNGSNSIVVGPAQGRHASGDSWYDADDAARDAADFVGCPDSQSPQPAACANVAPGGQGAVIFTIGLGDGVTQTPCDAFYNPSGNCGNLGETLLRYVAGAGDDNDPGTPPLRDPCNGVAAGNDCGNYYYAPTGAGLLRVFEAIASRIFTRLTH